MAFDPPPAPIWPRNARAACAFTFDLDAETLWMARGIHEPVTLSQGRFGPVEALPRILALLRTHDIRASFFIPAWVAEHHQDAVRAIVDGGHEIGCHGDEHERVSELPPDREEAILVRSVEVLTRLGGTRPLGYRAPAWQLSAATIPLLVQHGFAYSSNMMDRLSPYLHPAVGGRASGRARLVVLDDAPTSCSASGPSAPGRCFRLITEFDGITEARG